MLLDSNIIIYAFKSEWHQKLRQFILKHRPSVSAISYVEVLGYHKLSEVEQDYLEAFFADAPLLPLSHPGLRQAVELRQKRRMTLGDSLIAATALVHDLTLATRNIKDFGRIPGLRLIDPLE